MGKNKVDYIRSLPPIKLPPKSFYVYGLSDRILTPRGIEYLLFFEADEPFVRGPPEVIGRFEWFETENGFHAIGMGTVNAATKRWWFRLWWLCYPKTDYILSIENVLRPASDEEARWIYAQMPKDKSIYSPRCVRYYRDKRVFENWTAHWDNYFDALS